MQNCINSIRPQTKSTLFKIMFHIGVKCLAHKCDYGDFGQTAISSSLLKRMFPELSIRTIQRHLKTLMDDKIFEFRKLKKSTGEVNEPIRKFYDKTLEKRRAYNVHSQHTGLWHVRMNESQLKQWIQLVNALDQEDECAFNFIAKLTTGKDWKEIKNDNYARFQLGIRQMLSVERYNTITTHRKYFSTNAVRHIENGTTGWIGLHNKTQIATLRYALRCKREGRNYSWKTSKVLECVKKRVDKIAEHGNITTMGYTVLKLFDRFSQNGVLSKIFKTYQNSNNETYLMDVFCLNVAIYNNKEVGKITLKRTFPPKKQLTKKQEKWSEIYERGNGFNNKEQCRKRDMPAWVKEKIDRRKRGEEEPPKKIPEHQGCITKHEGTTTVQQNIAPPEECIKCSNLLDSILNKKRLKENTIKDNDQSIGLKKFSMYSQVTS